MVEKEVKGNENGNDNTGDNEVRVTPAYLNDDELTAVIYDEIIKSEVAEGWTLLESLMDRAAIDTLVAEDLPNADLEWRSLVNWKFISSPLDPRKPDDTGIRPGLKGSLLVIAFTILFAFPVGVGAALYLEEYATDNRLNRFIQTNINNLASHRSSTGCWVWRSSCEPWRHSRAGRCLASRKPGQPPTAGP